MSKTKIIDTPEITVPLADILSSEAEECEDIQDDESLDVENILAMIATHPKELFSLTPGQFDISKQFAEIMVYFQRNCWNDVEVELESEDKQPGSEDEQEVVEYDFDYESYSIVLETFVFSLWQYFNLLFQYFYMEKYSPYGVNVNPEQQALKTSAFWKIFLQYFSDVPLTDPKVKHSYQHEIDASTDIFDVLPAPLKDMMRKYLENACMTVYKTTTSD